MERKKNPYAKQVLSKRTKKPKIYTAKNVKIYSPHKKRRKRKSESPGAGRVRDFEM